MYIHTGRKRTETPCQTEFTLSMSSTQQQQQSTVRVRVFVCVYKRTRKHLDDGITSLHKFGLFDCSLSAKTACKMNRHL